LAGVGGRTVPLLAQLPEDSWLALGVADVGKSVRQGIDLVSKLGVPGLTPETLRLGLRSQTGLDLARDLLDWIGDMAFFVRGTSAKDVGGGVVIASSDPGASQRAIERIGALVKKQASGATKVSGSGADLTVTDPSLPEPVRIVARGDKVVIAYGEAATRAALAPAGKLGDSSAFKQAEGSLGAGVTPSGFVSIPAIVKLAESSTTADPSFTKARPYLDAFSNIAFGSRRDGADVVSRFVVGVK
jgi:hypothetical protein